MAFDFPSSPAEGQIFNAPGGPSYVFNTPVWKAVGQGQIAIISDTPPPSPANGALWYESDSGVLYIWYNDGNSSQWVQVGGVASGPQIRVTILTANGTYTKPVELRFLEVWLIGGGGGGGVTAGGAAGTGSAGGGGGAGAICYKFYAASALAASIPYTIGNGGGGGMSGGWGENGVPGGHSYFAGLTATGGGGGAWAAQSGSLTICGGGGGGWATGGDLNIGGGNGTFGVNKAHGGNIAFMGLGGNNYLCGPMVGAQNAFSGSSSPGNTGNFPGGGGSGACAFGAGAVNIGGAGAAGGIILKEYF